MKKEIKWHVDLAQISKEMYKGRLQVAVVDGDRVVATTFESEEEAAFIVRACNSHYEMLNALDLVAKSIADPNGTSSDFEDVIFKAITKAKGAA